MKIGFFGGCREVGGNAFLLKEDKNIFLDYGVRIGETPPKYPPIKKADAVLLSHAHLDHSGGLPRLYKKYRPKAYMTNVTFDLVDMLLKDSLKIAKKEHYKKPFTKKDFSNYKRNSSLFPYETKFRVGKTKCTFLDAGHIPGSSGILMENKKKVFYTGDINTNNTRLLKKCALPGKIDVLITESTYSYKEHPKRKKEEKKFLRSIEESVSNNQKVIIPVFAIGRTQEALLLLEKYVDKVALDGMAKTASDIIEYYGSYLRDERKLEKILEDVFWVRSNEDRERALKTKQIIVTTAGMMSGGPVIYYLKELKNDPTAKILFVGFLVEDSPGRKLIEGGRYIKGEESFEVKCKHEQFDLSSHSGKEGLMKIVKRTDPEKVFCVHGERCEDFAKKINKTFGIEAHAPEQGDIIEV